MPLSGKIDLKRQWNTTAWLIIERDTQRPLSIFGRSM